MVPRWCFAFAVLIDERRIGLYMWTGVAARGQRSKISGCKPGHGCQPTEPWDRTESYEYTVQTSQSQECTLIYRLFGIIMRILPVTSNPKQDSLCQPRRGVKLSAIPRCCYTIHGHVSRGFQRGDRRNFSKQRDGNCPVAQRCWPTHTGHGSVQARHFACEVGILGLVDHWDLALAMPESWERGGRRHLCLPATDVLT